MAGEISFAPSEKDHAEALRDWNSAHARTRRTAIVLVVFVLISGAAGGFSAYLDGYGHEIPATAAGFAIFALLLILLVSALIHLSLPWRARRLYRQQKSLHRPWTYCWSDDALTLETVHGRTSYAWSDFHRWRVGRGNVLLFLTDHHFLFLPRRLLDDRAVDELRRLVVAAGVPRL